MADEAGRAPTEVERIAEELKARVENERAAGAYADETDRRFLTRRTPGHWRSIARSVRKHPGRLRERLQQAVELPESLDEPALGTFLESVRVTDGPPEELRNYCRGDFWRFVRTYDLVRQADELEPVSAAEARDVG
jgi:hypothetical protein